MPILDSIKRKLEKIFILNAFTTVILVLTVFSFIWAAGDWLQWRAETGAIPATPPGAATEPSREQYEVAKLRAEIQQIRSDTSGSLFGLKLIALFVTVGGYLYGQHRSVRQRLDFEQLKEVDAVYQSILNDLSHDSPLLRAAAAVKLGALLKSFPAEWSVSEARRDQMIQLTKQVLSACLAIEKDEKVLKTLTIALVLHRRWGDDPAEVKKKKFGDASNLDLSGAKAEDAYWARVDFTYADFFKAKLAHASLRESVLVGAQFREADLRHAVLADADCERANFKQCDLRHADLTGAKLAGATFAGARVHGAKFGGALPPDADAATVNVSPEDGGVEESGLAAWLASQGAAARTQA